MLRVSVYSRSFVGVTRQTTGTDLSDNFMAPGTRQSYLPRLGNLLYKHHVTFFILVLMLWATHECFRCILFCFIILILSSRGN